MSAKIPLAVKRRVIEADVRIRDLEAQVDALLAHCPDGECPTCATIVCPHKCDMHFHHDGCPACAEYEDERG
jgi:hypothetical protein